MAVEESDIVRLEKYLERIENKIDAQETRFVTRLEYEARHAAMINDFTRLELEQKAHNQEHDQEMKALRVELDSSKVAIWKEAALALIGVLTGGGVIGFLSYLHVFTGK